MKCLFLLATTITALSLVAVDVPGPYARWTMESVSEVGGTRTIADLTGSGRSLTLGAGCSLTNDSPSGNGLYFNGEQSAYATFPHPAMNSRTIAFWVKLDAEDGSVYTSLPEYWVEASQSWKVTFPYFVGDFGRTRLYYQTRWDNVFYVGSGRASEVDRADQVFSCNKVGANFRKEWNFVTLVYDQSDTSEGNVKNVHMSLYLNGSLYYDYGTKAVTNACEAGTATLGNVGVNGSRPMKGVLADVAVWDVALTAEEVFALYAPKFHPTDKRLLAVWDCSEITSTGGVRTVADSSGNGYDLKLNTGVTATNGIVGGGLAWSGESGAGAKTVAALPQLSDWTFCAWINPSAGIASPKVTGNGAPRIFQFAGAYGTLHLIGSLSNLNFAYVPVNAAANSTDTPGQGILGHGLWTHFTLVTHTVIDAAGTGFESYVTWYLNGVKAGESTHRAASRQYATTADFLLGCNDNSPGGNRVYEGAMDDIRIYAGVLSDAEVRALYLMPPQPDAGADFTVAREDVVLIGKLNGILSEENPGNLGGSVEWSLVSAPGGAAEGVVLGAPFALECPVTLPALGAYVFRLTTATSAGERSDEVTVTRIAEPASNVPPTVSLAASATCTLPDSLPLNAVVADSDSAPGTLRVCWSRVSGPGPVYFDSPALAATRATFAAAGEYVLKCEADDGLARESAQIAVTVAGSAADLAVTNGLINYWPLSGKGGSLGTDVVGGRTLTANNSARWIAGGHDGYGLEIYADRGYASTTSANFPNASTLTVACWIYHDHAHTALTGTAMARLFSCHYANAGGGIEMQYGASESNPPILLRMKWNTGVTDNFVWLFRTPPTNMRDRWTHVAAIYNLNAAANARTDCTKLYIDGAEMVLNKFSTNESTVVAADVAQPSFPGVLKQAGQIFWGSTGASNRVFPGVIDDMRIYGRALSAGEISRLAKAAPDANLPPQVSLAETDCRVMRNRPLALSALCLDDGRPSSEALSGTWRLAAGDASGVEIANGMATFSEEGCYRLEYVATDGEWQTGSRVVTVRVMPLGLVIRLR